MNATSVTTIQDLLAAGRIMEANALLIADEASGDDAELRGYAAEIDQRLTQAEALVAQAATMEQEGQVEAAKALYESVLLLAADFPDIGEHISRMDEALQLTRAVQRRSKRLRRSQSVATEKTNKRPWTAWGAGMIGMGLVAVLLLLMLIKPQLPPPNKRTAVAPAHAIATTPAPASASQTTPEPSIPGQDKPASSSVLAEKGHQATSSERQESPPAASGRHQLHAPGSGGQAPATFTFHSPTATSNRPTGLYTVRPDDSLSSIARNELCNNMAWQQIYQLNRERIADPDKLLPGMVLRLNGLENRCPPARQPSSQTGSQHR